MYYLFIDLLVCLHWKNPRFRAFLDSNLHTRLAIVTANELGLAFPPRNLPKTFRPDPSTFYLVIVVTDRQTDRQTNAGKNIIPRFRGDNNTNKRIRCRPGPDLQNILRQSYDYLTIMPKLRSTYDGRLIYKTSTKGTRIFLGTIHLQNCNIV